MQVMGGVGGHHTAAEGRYLMLGNGFLLLNTLAMALYYLRCGPMLTNPLLHACWLPCSTSCVAPCSPDLS